jgi:hypothetical protein
VRLHASCAAFDPERKIDLLVNAEIKASAGGGPVYRTACERYFERRNYRVTGLEWLVTIVRADIRLPSLRTPGAAKVQLGELTREITEDQWSADHLEPR